APPLADVLVQRHKAEGVKFIFCAQVTAIENRKITLKNGSEITADLVVAAIGAVPETDLAERSGLVVQNGIVVNAELETSDKSIFAAGDCCNFPSSHTGDKIRLESWRNAVEQGVHAAANMLGAAKEYKKTPWFWSDQYDLTLQAAGVSQPGQTYLRRELETKAVILFQLGQDGKLFSASGLGPTGSVAKEIRIAELMMERGIQPDPSALVDAQINLKTLLRSS
ncbi:MAG: ferredoxin reductase, partial [Blastopirellula sp.]